MTKDRPRNRPGKGPKQGDSGSSGGGFKPPGKPYGKPGWKGADTRPRPPREAGSEAGGDKPWRNRRDDERRGKPGDKPPGKFQGNADRPRPPHDDRAGGGKPWGGKPPRDREEAREQPAKPRGRTFDKPRWSAAERPAQPETQPVSEAAGDQNPWGGDASSPPPRRDAGSYGKPDRGPRTKPHHRERRIASFEDGDQVWIWGLHAAGAVLKNSRRRVTRGLVTRNAAQRVGLDPDNLPAKLMLVEAKEIDQAVPADAVHQGLAVKVWALDAENIEAFAIQPERPIVVLDQVTDPQNVGAVFRSAAAFDFAAVVLQTRNAPALGGALAKAAAGALEQVAEVRSVNLSRAIEQLVGAGWNVVGLDGSAPATIDEAFSGDRPLAIVMGAEGAGLRPGVANACSMLARIPIGEGMESLNVSNAAAIAFYEAARRAAVKPAPKQAEAAPIADDINDE